MNAIKYAWYYLITNGTPNKEPAYYGGESTVDDNIPFEKSGIHGWYKSYDNYAKKKIAEEGIDWYKTEAPRTKNYGVFNGTFCDASEKEYLTGTLYFRDGSSLFYCSEPIEVGNVFEMMALFEETKKKAIEMFGEDE